jgi:hypothetical protein
MNTTPHGNDRNGTGPGSSALLDKDLENVA